MVYRLRRQVPWLQFGIQHATYKSIRASLVPTLSQFGINISNALNAQGILTVIGLLLGASAVVSFTAIRTIVNLIKQFNSMIYYSVLPEFSTALATGNTLLAKKLHRYACQISLFFTLFNIIALAFLGPTIVRIWTNGKLEVDYLFFMLMLLSMLPNTFYVTSAYVHMSINRIGKIAIICLLASAFSVGFTYVLIPVFGLAAAPIVQMGFDTLLLLVIVRDSLLLLQDKTPDFVQSLFRFAYLKRIRQLRKQLVHSS